MTTVYGSCACALPLVMEELAAQGDKAQMFNDVCNLGSMSAAGFFLGNYSS